MQVDVQVAPGAEGPKVTLSCPDRTSVVPLNQLLPALRSLTNKVVEAAVEREHAAGREISCKAGCGACCRQLVPISITEAQQLPSLIADLSEAHRQRVMAKFEDAISKLRASNLWNRLETYASLSPGELMALGMEYFQLGIACPFLEDESCSIHPVRPLACRQYLVTSPPEHCTHPIPEKITLVTLAANVLGALCRIERREPSKPRGVPLTLAPFMCLPEDESKKTVPDWMSQLLVQIKTMHEKRIAAGRAPDALDAD